MKSFSNNMLSKDKTAVRETYKAMAAIGADRITAAGDAYRVAVVKVGTLTLLIMMTAILMGMATDGQGRVSRVYGATIIKNIDLSYNAERIALNTHFTESEVSARITEYNEHLPKNVALSAVGCELDIHQCALYEKYDEPTKWALSGDGEVNADCQYAILFLINITDGYDLASSVKSHTDYTAPESISTVGSDLTVNINGAKRTDLDFFYTEVGDTVKNISIYVPIGKPSTEAVPPTVWQVDIKNQNDEYLSDGSIDLAPGDTYQFLSEVYGLKLESEADKKVAWSLAGAADPGTKIDAATGKFTIGAGEPTSTGKIKITATSAVSGVTRSVTVNVQKGLTIDFVEAGVAAGFTENVARGGELEFWAVAEGTHSNKTVSCTLSGNTSADTKIVPYIEGVSGQWVLKVAKDEKAAVLTITAASEADPSKSKMLTLKVGDMIYIKEVKVGYDIAKLGITADSNESDVSIRAGSAVTADVAGMEFQSSQTGLMQIHDTGITAASELKIDPAGNYGLSYVFHLKPGYDIQDEYKAYKYENMTTAGKLPGFSVIVNGKSRDDVIFFYADAYRTVTFLVPITSEVQEEIKKNGSGSGSGSGGSGTSGAAGQSDDKSGKEVFDTGISSVYGGGSVLMTGIKDKAYTGKAVRQSPVLTVGGTTLKAGTDYKLTYKNNKNVGTATLTVTGAGSYQGTYTVTFKINPKGTKLKRVKAKKKSSVVTWKTLKAKMSKKKITGYQIQYSTSSKFKAAKIKKIKGAAKTKITIKKLKSKKKYSFRIRTYMKVGKKTYYSAWSKTKKVKVR